MEFEEGKIYSGSHGNSYMVLTFAKSKETDEVMVVYIPVQLADKVYVTSLAEFSKMIGGE